MRMQIICDQICPPKRLEQPHTSALRLGTSSGGASSSSRDELVWIGMLTLGKWMTLLLLSTVLSHAQILLP